MSHKIDLQKAALLVIDVQERLCAAMNAAALDRVVNRTVAAIHGARALAFPVVATEQYPKGLGPTLPGVKALYAEPPVEKVNFSCALDEVLARLQGRTQVLVAGMEAHVCVFQTVRDLTERGLSVLVMADAVISRTELDRSVGLDLCRQAGATVTTVEAALFDALGRAGTPEFKAVSQAVK